MEVFQGKKIRTNRRHKSFVKNKVKNSAIFRKSLKSMSLIPVTLTSLFDSHFKDTNIRFHETKVDGKDLTTAVGKTAESMCEGSTVFHGLCTWRSGYCYLTL